MTQAYQKWHNYEIMGAFLSILNIPKFHNTVKWEIFIDENFENH